MHKTAKMHNYKVHITGSKIEQEIEGHDWKSLQYEVRYGKYGLVVATTTEMLTTIRVIFCKIF